MKTIYVLLVLFFLIVGGCSVHDWPDSEDIYIRHVEFGIEDGIKAPGEMICIETSFSYATISVTGNARINGESSLTIGPNGYWWIWVDVSSVPPGGSIVIDINGDILTCLVE
ncbi:MAG: hypothetical protein PVJ39_04805 [Gammaproteobacteria bacterium]|jgi:hypothetical protein